MKIGLFGYGKMGRLIEEIAISEDHTIHICHSTTTQIETSRSLIQSMDLCIDFSVSELVIPHIKICCEEGKNLLIGTTGWEESLKEAEELVNFSKIGCLYSPNFSLGIALFQKLIRQAAKLISSFPSYDVSGVELHHAKKKDAPSGTALALEKIFLEELPQKTSLSFASVRSGHFPGTHSLFFDSPADTITLTHEARNRSGFAFGALLAAKWLKNKQGFYTFQDFIQELLP